MPPIQNEPDLLGCHEHILHTEPESDETANDLEGELQIMSGHLSHHVPVLGPAHPVVHPQLHQCYDNGYGRRGQCLGVDLNQGPQQDQVHETHGELVHIFHIVAEDLELLQIQRHKHSGQQRRHDVEKQNQFERRGVFVDCGQRLRRAGQRDALHHGEDKGAPEFDQVVRHVRDGGIVGGVGVDVVHADQSDVHAAVREADYGQGEVQIFQLAHFFETVDQ
mmetsp:Transcript_40406/g.94941  ORF Transcript_40406/g.94941 Transcript_40406/m.94941 type:complete len:221 (+) Transcript_40406:811-1473(+)